MSCEVDVLMLALLFGTRCTGLVREASYLELLCRVHRKRENWKKVKEKRRNGWAT